MAVDVLSYRRAMRCVPAAVTVVTSRWEGINHGMTATSVTSVSLEPISLLVCLQRRARTASAIRAHGYFAVNVLRADQDEMCRRFAAPGQDHFAGLEVRDAPGDVPLLPGCLAHLVCRVGDVMAAGDHDIFLGCPEHMETNLAGGALISYLGGLRALPGPTEPAGILVSQTRRAG